VYTTLIDSCTRLSPLAWLVAMAATPKAPWTTCLVALIVQGIPTASSLRSQAQQMPSRAAANLSSTSAQSYELATSGEPCPGGPGDIITSTVECSNAASELGLCDTTAVVQPAGALELHPTGCWIHTPSSGGCALYVNPSTTTSAVCQATQRCLCRQPSATQSSATGDPHLQNIHGERFDLMKAGKHVLINIPREARAESAMLRVEADARRLGRVCADIYFQELNITGLWAEAKQAGGYHYDSSSGVKERPEWLTFGKVAAKIVHGRTQDDVQYLNLYVKHLGRAGFVVGGLLGEDDYHDVAAPDASCAKQVSLKVGIRTNSPDARSFAIASAA